MVGIRQILSLYLAIKLGSPNFFPSTQMFISTIQRVWHEVGVFDTSKFGGAQPHSRATRDLRTSAKKTERDHISSLPAHNSHVKWGEKRNQSFPEPKTSLGHARKQSKARIFQILRTAVQCLHLWLPCCLRVQHRV
jgi:hypothetical protein